MRMLPLMAEGETTADVPFFLFIVFPLVFCGGTGLVGRAGGMGFLGDAGIVSDMTMENVCYLSRETILPQKSVLLGCK